LRPFKRLNDGIPDGYVVYIIICVVVYSMVTFQDLCKQKN